MASLVQEGVDRYQATTVDQHMNLKCSGKRIETFEKS
jgi:hypothetical protein